MEIQTDFAGISVMKFAIACATVAGLMGIMVLVLKRFAARGWILPKTGATRRLKIVESLPLDARRRVVIVTCDGTETLLLLGPQDLVIKELPPDT